jgi:D-serine ammonia-lyase
MSYRSPANNAAALKTFYVNQRFKLTDLETPAAILDIAVVRRNCKRMLNTAKELGVQFRAHIKTHKVIYLSCFTYGSIITFRDHRRVPLASR